MKYFRIILTAFVLFVSLAIRYAQTDADDEKRVVFLGDSITWMGGYVNDVEAYLTFHYPNVHFLFINVGLPSETVSGLSEPGHADGKFPRPDLHERLERVLSQTKPDLVFACYGMNDGIYLPFDSVRFYKFKEGITWMHKKIVKTGARVMHLTPPDYDELKGKSVGYAAVLDTYSNWLISLRSSAKWEVIDVHFPMQEYLESHRKVDSAFALAADGVHPNEAGHWIMARQILLYLGYKEVAYLPGIVQNLATVPNGEQILKLIIERQNMMRDAWLTATKYKRPGLPEGLPLSEAEIRFKKLGQEISALNSK